jgi:hypothetical protein
VRSVREERSSPTEKGGGQEERDGQPKVVEFPPGRPIRPKNESLDPGNFRDVDELSDTDSRIDLEQAMTAPPSREEIDAKLEAAEARTEARFAQLAGTLDVRFANLDVRFANLDNKVDRLADSIVRLSTEITESRREARVEYRTTRITMIVTAVASVLAIIGILLSSQANLLSAFQAGLATKAVSSLPRP